MDPLETMTATDWRRVYERSQEYATKLLGDLAAARRRESELVDRLRRRDEENKRMRNDIASQIVEEERTVQQRITEEPLNSWLAGLLFGLQRARDIVQYRAREIAGEEPHSGACAHIASGLILDGSTCARPDGHTGDHSDHTGDMWENTRENP